MTILAPNHRIMLEASGIDPEVIEQRGYFTATTKQELAEAGFADYQLRPPTLVIPIFDVAGEIANHQHRPDSPRVKDGKPVKYETKAGAKVVLDVPPRARPWLRDPERALFITEGAKKADSAVSRGLCCIDVLGVWNWRAGSVLADWDFIHLKDRDVYLAFDSDVVEKENVAMALARLKGFLEKRHARVKIIYLPADDGAKVGLDDFLATHSVDELLAHATTEIRKPNPKRDATGSVPPQGDAPAALTFDHSNVGDAELLAHIHGDHLRYDHRTARWLDFRPAMHRYVEPVGGEMTRYALDAARARLERGWASGGDAGKGDINRAQRMRDKMLITAMLDIAHDLPPIDASGVEWDAQAHLLACTNGVLDLRTGILRPGVASDNITRGVPIAYDPAAKAPTWERFLASVLGDAEIVAFLLRAMGYTLTGDTTEQVLFLCHGGGANGKSTLFNVLRWVFGPELAGTVRFAAFEADANGDASRDLADLPGKRLAIGAETPEGRTFASETVKAVTGCEPITTARKYGHPFTFTPTFKLWLGTNHLPKVKDDSEGFWRRVLVVLFGAQFTGPDQDRHMGEKLRAEVPGILASIVRGAMDWYANGLHPPASVLMEVQNYRSREDLVAQFLVDCCTTDPGAETPAKELIAAFAIWSDEQGLRGKERMSATAFGKRLTVSFEKVHRRDGWYYFGVTIRDGCDGLEQFPQTFLEDSSRKEVPGKPFNPSQPSQPSAYCQVERCTQIVCADRPCPVHSEGVTQ